MKNSVMLLAVLLAIPSVSFAKDTQALDFVNHVKQAADADGSVQASIAIDCPVPAASGKVIISKASYEVNSSNGVFVFKDLNEQQAQLTTLVTMYPDDNFASEEITGMSFIFKLPKGQFFVDVFKDGKTRAGVNKNGQSGINWIQCKIVKPV